MPALSRCRVSALAFQEPQRTLSSTQIPQTLTQQDDIAMFDAVSELLQNVQTNFAEIKAFMVFVMCTDNMSVTQHALALTLCQLCTAAECADSFC